MRGSRAKTEEEGEEEEKAMTDQPASTSHGARGMRLPTYIYGLIYPAFLGSFLFGALTAPFPDGWHGWAAGLMMLYFAAQFGEGAIVAYQLGEDGRPRYGKVEAGIDIAEILAMVAIMAAIGIFGAAPTGLLAHLFGTESRFDHWGWIAAAFAIPPIGRLIFSFIGGPEGRRSHDVKAHGRLTLLSFTAAVGALLGYVSPTIGLGIISAALLVYLLIFIGWPHIGEGLVRHRLRG